MQLQLGYYSFCLMSTHYQLEVIKTARENDLHMEKFCGFCGLSDNGETFPVKYFHSNIKF